MKGDFSIIDGIDLRELFLPAVPLAETFLRGTVVYLALFAMLRILLKRESSNIGVTNLLLIVLLADASQNALAADYGSITDGVLLVATIAMWSYALDWLAYRFPVMNRIIKPGRLLLARNGRMMRGNMRHELITHDELMSELRRHGLKDLDEAQEVWMESNGAVSVIAKTGRTRPSTPPERRE